MPSRYGSPADCGEDLAQGVGVNVGDESRLGEDRCPGSEHTWRRFRNLRRFLISLLNRIINERFFIEKPYFRFEKNCDKILAAEANR